MIEVLPAPDHVMALRIRGKVTTEDYDRVYRELGSKLKRYEKIGVCADTAELRGVTPRAFAKNLAYSLARLGEWRRFPREAVITDKRWLQALSRLSGAAFRKIDVRAFAPDDRAAALAWAAEVPRQPRLPALRVIPTTRPDTCAFVWNGRISREDVAEFVQELNARLGHHEKVRLLGRIEHLGGIVPGAFAESGLFSLKRALLRKVERYAVVGGPPRLSRYLRAVRSLTGIDVRHFDAAAEMDAWAWLEARPAVETVTH